MLPIHQTCQLEVTLQDHHSAIHVGSGDLPVFGTPAMIALMEKASVQLVAPHLEEGASTVGIHLDVHHTEVESVIRPGTANTSRPYPEAIAAVRSEPPRSALSTTRVA